MSEKNVVLKDYKKENGEKYYPVANFSKATYSLAKGVAILGGAIYLLSILGRIVKIGVGYLANFLIELNSTDPATISLPAELARDTLGIFIVNPQNLEPRTTAFLDKLQLEHVAIMVLEIAGLIAVVYGVTLMFRHHYGEQRPLFDDMESRRLKKEALRGLDVGYDPNKLVDSDADKKRKRAQTQLESDVLTKLKSMSVSVHTRRDLELNEDVREYVVKIRQPKSKKVRDTLFRSIDDLGGILTRATNGEATFGEVNIDISGKYFSYKSDVKIDKLYEEKNKKSKQHKAKEKEKSEVLVPTDSEFTFPLELFKNNIPLIDSKKEQANKYADKVMQELELYFGSSQEPMIFDQRFVGNTSVQYRFSIAKKRNFRLSEMQNNLPTYLNEPSVMLELDGSTLLITVPLPQEARVPIDVPTMIAKVF